MRHGLLRTAPMAAALIFWVAQNACASPSAQDQTKSPRIASVASEAVKTAPVALVTEEQPDAVMARAAVAARRDLDPQANGSVNDIRRGATTGR